MEPNVIRVIREAVAETLDCETDAVPLHAAVVADLGAESIELVDVLFRVECALGVQLAIDEIGTLLQGDLADHQFVDARGMLTGAGRAQLASILSVRTGVRLTAGLRPDQVSALLTVEDLATLLSPLLTPDGSRPCLVR
jgi:acyl carrier protein